jgi:serine/threonine-protein kinase
MVSLTPPTLEMIEFEQRLKETLSSAYNIERELGGGGMSRVFVATDRILGRKIVIKVLSPELTAEVNRGRFRREMQVAAQLQHPHIVPLLSAGEQDDLLYFTMPFIKGESLKTAVEKDGRMSVAEVARVLNHVGEALEYAHEAGIVHRDIKPANILRSGSYSLITDFGVAKAINAALPSQGAMTSTGMAIGTPAYMAPEQLAGDSAADHRIDIYAVGLLGYELLNGRSPFAGTTPQRMLAAVLTQEPQPLIDVRTDVPQSLSDVIMRCLAKEPANRPANAREFLNSLDVFAISSGEIRTIEQRVPHIVHTPTPTSGVTPVVTREGVIPAEEFQSSTGEIEPVVAESPSREVPSYDVPRKSRAGMYAGIVGVLAVIAIGGFFMSQRGSSEATIVAAAPPPIVADSAPVVAAPPPAVTPESTVVAVAPAVDSARVADSVKKARREAAKKALAQAESVRVAREVNAKKATMIRARTAAAAMLTNAAALDAFNHGATHKGGVLNSKRKGDLQTQIDALQPFLARAGLNYAQFKDIVNGSGVNIYDEFGRIDPEALKKFAGVR